jgi:hypothetical protein
MSNGLEHYQRLFYQRAQQPIPPKYPRRKLDPSSLPTARHYLAQSGLLDRVRGEWASIRCPVHKGGDERHASMSVSLVDGHFCCHACGVKGPGIVKLHMLRTGLRWEAAVRDLGGRFHD